MILRSISGSRARHRPVDDLYSPCPGPSPCRVSVHGDAILLSPALSLTVTSLR